MKNYQDRKFYQYQPYYKGTLHTINNSLTSNNMFSTKIRLNSANNSLGKNKNLSQDKLKYFTTNNYHPLNTNNYLSIQNRSTSVKNPQNNFLYPTKNKNMNFGQSMDLNYPNIALNSNSVSQNNNILYQRKRQIIYEADNELAEEYDKLR